MEFNLHHGIELHSTRFGKSVHKDQSDGKLQFKHVILNWHTQLF